MIRDTSEQDQQIQRKPSRGLKLAIIVGVLIISGASLWSMINTRFNADVSVNIKNVRIDEVTRGTLERDINATGKIVAANAPVLYSPEAGHVTFLAKPGDEATKGQVLARVDSPELSNKYRQQQSVLEGLISGLDEANLVARRSQLALNQKMDLAKVILVAAEREYRRAKKSIAAHIISQFDYEEAVDNLTRAKLTSTHAQQESELGRDTFEFQLKNRKIAINRQQLIVKDLQRKIADLEIKAPVSGIIGNWSVAQKTRVSNGSPLLTVIDLSAYEAELSVPESYADELGLGMPVEIQIAGNQLQGILASISPEIRDRQVIARVKFDNKNIQKREQQQSQLRQNQRLSARILLEKKLNVLMVKRGAFIQSAAGRATYVVNNNIATRRTISLGATSISHVELTSGVVEGESMIVSSLNDFASAEQVLLR